MIFVDSEGYCSEAKNDSGTGGDDASTAPQLYYLPGFAKEPDSAAKIPGEDTSVKDNNAYGHEDDGSSGNGSGDSTSDGGEDAVGAAGKDELPASRLNDSPSYDGALGNSVSHQLQDPLAPFLSGAVERPGSDSAPHKVFPRASNSWVDAKSAVGTKETRPDATGGAARQ